MHPVLRRRWCGGGGRGASLREHAAAAKHTAAPTTGQVGRARLGGVCARCYPPRDVYRRVLRRAGVAVRGGEARPPARQYHGRVVPVRSRRGAVPGCASQGQEEQVHQPQPHRAAAQLSSAISGGGRRSSRECVCGP
eukprot:ctg_3363.g422